MRIKAYLDSSLSKINSILIGAIQKIDLRILFFIILCLNFLSFTLSQNEESYLPLAKQFMDPSWMPDSFIFNEWPGNRLVFQAITGLFLRYFEFEPFVFFARMATFLLISIPLAAIFRKLEVKNLYALLFFQIFLLHQNYFAQEFIFGDYEVKSLAYIFVMAGVYFLLNNKYLVAVVISIIACYLHILVGGWFFVLIFIYSFFATKSWKLIISESLLFIFLLSPFLLYLGNEILKTGPVINGVNIDWVSVYFRNAHHTAPLSIKERLPEVLLQISATGILFLCTLFIFRKFKGELLNKLFILNVIAFSLLFFSLFISLFDKTGFFLKFYPFRLAALGCFLMYLFFILLLKRIPKISNLIISGFLVLGLYLVIAASVNTFQQIFKPDPKTGLNELVEFVKQHTDAKDVFLNLGDYDISFSRKTRRDEFVVFKFDPGGGKKIYKWYKRIQERKAVANDLKRLQDLKREYRLNYLLCDRALDEKSMLQLVFQNNSYYLYKIL